MDKFLEKYNLPSLNHEEIGNLNSLVRRLNQHSKCPKRDFSGGTVVKNPPGNAGHTGSSPGPGGSHMPESN